MRANAQAASSHWIDPLAQSHPSQLGQSHPSPLGFQRTGPIELDTLVDRALAASPSGPRHGRAAGDAPACALAVDGERLEYALTLLIRAATTSGRAVRLGTHVDAAGAEIRVEATGRKASGGSAIDADEDRAAAMAQEQLIAASALIQSQDGRLLRRWAGPATPATLLIRLPTERTLEPLPRARSARHQPSGRRHPARQRLEGIHVLLVEDDPDALEFLTLIVRQTGARVSPFGLAQPAYDFFVAAERKPDIVVSDIAMPGQDGYQLLRRLRRWEGGEGQVCVPAIAVSAFGRNEDVRRCVAAGFDRHLAKPVEAARILEEIAAWFPALH